MNTGEGCNRDSDQHRLQLRHRRHHFRVLPSKQESIATVPVAFCSSSKDRQRGVVIHQRDASVRCSDETGHRLRPEKRQPVSASWCSHEMASYQRQVRCLRLHSRRCQHRRCPVKLSAPVVTGDDVSSTTTLMVSAPAPPLMMSAPAFSASDVAVAASSTSAAAITLRVFVGGGRLLHADGHALATATTPVFVEGDFGRCTIRFNDGFEVSDLQIVS